MGTIIALFAAFIIYTIYVIGDVKILSGGSDKAVIINNAQIDGWTNGSKAWEFFANTGWSTIDRSMTVLQGVSRGVVYQDIKPSITSIEAWEIKIINSRNKIEVLPEKDEKTQQIIKQLYAQADIKSLVSDREKGPEQMNGYSRIWADSLVYDSATKTSQVEGNIRIKDNNREIFASKMEINNADRTAKITELARIYGKNFKLVGNNMTSYLKEDRISVENDVCLILRHKKNITRIYCDKLDYFSKTNNSNMSGKIRIIRKDMITFANSGYYDDNAKRLDVDGNVRATITKNKKTTKISCDKAKFDTSTNDILCTGNIEIYQHGKMAVSKTCKYDSNSDKVTLIGDVRVVIEKGHTLIKKESADKLRDPEVRQSLREKTTITADQFEISATKGDTVASGNVVVAQNGKLSKSDTAKYDEKKEDIIMTDNVYMEKEGQWVKTNKIIVSVKNETFDAIGNVETKFIFKEKKNMP